MKKTYMQETVGKTMCQTTAFSAAMDCSACMGAAGRSNQTTYRSQMEAYGWYKNNCTLVGGGTKVSRITNVADRKVAKDTALTAVETVDEPKVPASNIPPKASPAAPPAQAAAMSPKIVYVDSGAKHRIGVSVGTLLLAGVMSMAMWP